ncbi:MAG: extensin family protein [Hyphomicrobium sp.]|uniref:extensin family protein n=1 Tax=Hyphomicrobium sp. TaxID=82 RepID=UPI0039E64AEA
MGVSALAALAAAIVSCLCPTFADAKQKKSLSPATQTPTAKAADSATPPNAETPAGTPTPSPTAPPKSDAQAAQKPAQTWSDAEIAVERAHCAVVLQRIHAVAVPHAPIREGACGAPAPIELMSIGKDPEVALSPPAIVRCDLAEQLVNWFEKDVQPLALKHLKSQIVRIETMSSYSCRNAYGRKTTKLSEHGLANAVDIGGFITASAKTAEVLDDWGKPEREIVAEAEARQKAAEEAAAKTAQAGVAGNPAQGVVPPIVPSTTGAAAAGIVRLTIVEVAPNTSDVPKAPAIADANRLGGPPPKPVKDRQRVRPVAFVGSPSIDNPDPEMKAFLHEAHEAACKIFGTTLGPEANAAHRNHFHVDMAPRKFTKICD